MKKIKSKSVILPFLGLFIIILVIWTAWGNRALIVSEISISSDRLPIAFSGFRIAQVSDLHNTEFGTDSADLLQLLKKCQPDIIVITGDLIDSRHTDVEIAIHFTQESVKIAPTYYVTGNHEARCPQYQSLKTGLEAAEVVVLEDDAVPLEQNGEWITLLGLADPSFTIKGNKYGEVPEMVSAKLHDMHIQENTYSILLSHRPELFETYAAYGVDLVLSGHAHGGQFRLPFIGGLVAPNQGLFPKYDAGLYTGGNTNMIVSRGLGNSIIPVRFNNRPEVVLVELLAKNAI